MLGLFSRQARAGWAMLLPARKAQRLAAQEPRVALKTRATRPTTRSCPQMQATGAWRILGKLSASPVPFFLLMVFALSVFDPDVDVSEDSPPPLPERTPESFVLAGEHRECLFCVCVYCVL